MNEHAMINIAKRKRRYFNEAIDENKKQITALFEKSFASKYCIDSKTLRHEIRFGGIDPEWAEFKVIE